MDSGEEIQGLDDDWTFMGCKMFEWGSGFMVFIILHELMFKGATASGMPILLCAWIGTTQSLRALRETVPDQEKGIVNYVAVSMGFNPPKIPTPAALQNIWSTCPIRELNPESNFMKLGLLDLFPHAKPEDDDAPRKRKVSKGGS
jgi:hypothetical protein